MMGIPLLLETIEKLRTKANKDLTILGVLPTMYNARNKHDTEALAELRASLEPAIRVFAPVTRSTGFDKAAAENRSTAELLPRTPGIESYQVLAEEIIKIL